MSKMWADRSLRAFLQALGTGDAVPGGGAACSVSAGLAAGLLGKVLQVTMAREPEKAESLRAARLQVMGLVEACTRLVDRDAEALERVGESYRLPDSTAEDQVERRMRMGLAMRKACDVSLEVAERGVDLLGAAADVARLGRASTLSDVGVGNFLALAAVMGAALNVEANLAAMEDEDFARAAAERLSAVQERSRALFDSIQQTVLDRMVASA